MKTRDSITLDSWSSLSRFGINYLTGEADALGLRLLCDLNEPGAELIREYLGLPADAPLAGAWNAHVEGLPAIASILLHRQSFEQLATFALLRAGALAVLVSPGHHAMTGIFDADLLTRYVDFVECSDGYSLIRHARPTGPHIGTRNTHAFSGRTE